MRRGRGGAGRNRPGDCLVGGPLGGRGGCGRGGTREGGKRRPGPVGAAGQRRVPAQATRGAGAGAKDRPAVGAVPLVLGAPVGLVREQGPAEAGQDLSDSGGTPRRPRPGLGYIVGAHPTADTQRPPQLSRRPTNPRERHQSLDPQETGPIPAHKHGSVHFANLGCKHHECVQARSQAKARLRRRRREERIFIPQVMPDGSVENRWVHPALAPTFAAANPRRHGTAYGRREFSCDCPPCSIARSNRESIREEQQLDQDDIDP